MSAKANKELVLRLIDEVWNQHDATAIGRWFGPGLREEVAGHYRQLLAGFPDLQVRVEGDLIAEGELVAARLTLRGTHAGPFAGRDATGRTVSWSSIRIYRLTGGRVAETWAMQDRLGLLEQVGAIAAPATVNWAGAVRDRRPTASPADRRSGAWGR